MPIGVKRIVFFNLLTNNRTDYDRHEAFFGTCADCNKFSYHMNFNLSKNEFKKRYIWSRTEIVNVCRLQIY